MEFFTLLIVFLIAALSGMGIGGGGLFVIYLALFTEAPQLTAQGINLLFFVCAATAALIRYTTHKQIKWRAATLLSLAGLFGCAIGTHLAHQMPPHLLTQAFGWFMILVGVLTLVKR